jgi:hypothetical protein
MAMIAITTSNSINVNADDRRFEWEAISAPRERETVESVRVFTGNSERRK